jgi:hypothetical protein
VVPWWAAEIERLRPVLRSSLHRHASFEPGVEDDIVAEAMLELTQRLESAPDRYPASWFASAMPSEPEAVRFRALARLICRRRLYDRLRRFYVGRTYSDLPLQQARYSAETQAADRELLGLVVQQIEQLDVEDRELLIRGMERGGDETPLTTHERVRLSRLRSRLLKVLSEATHEK